MLLLKLSAEVLSKIFTVLVEDGNLVHAKNLRLCCKKLASIGLDELFRIAVLTPDEEHDADELLHPPNWFLKEDSDAASENAERSSDSEEDDHISESSENDNLEHSSSTLKRRPLKFFSFFPEVEGPVIPWPGRSFPIEYVYKSSDYGNFPMYQGEHSSSPLEIAPKIETHSTGAPAEPGRKVSIEESQYLSAGSDTAIQPEGTCGSCSPEISVARHMHLATCLSTDTQPNAEHRFKGSVPSLKGSIAKFKHLQNNPQLRLKVMRVIVKTTMDLEENMEESEYLGHDWHEALLGIANFRNLTSISIVFHPNCSAEEGSAHDGAQNLSCRFWVMKILLSALTSLPKLKSLEITDLQNLNSKKITDSVEFVQTLSRLQGLHLDIATEMHRWTRQHGLDFREVYPFFSIELPRYWLARACGNNLTWLSLGADIPWGWNPNFDTRGLLFPKLKELFLRNYTLACDAQLDWLCSFGADLETLMLDKCPIAFYSRSDATEAEDVVCREGQKWFMAEKYEPKRRNHWVYNVRWHDLLPRIERSLPALKRFALKGARYGCFGGGLWDFTSGRWCGYILPLYLFDPSEREPPYQLETGLRKSPFVPLELSKAASDSIYLDDNDSSLVGCGEKDQAALEQILSEVGQRARKKC